MNANTLDYELGRLHDASLLGLSIDWIRREAVLTALTDDEDETPRKLNLRVVGLAWLAMGPPDLYRGRGYEYTPAGGPLMDAMIGTQGQGAPKALAISSRQTITIYVRSWNSFIWIGADSFLLEEVA